MPPPPFTNIEYADMHLVLGDAHGNAERAVQLYARLYPNRRLPNPRTFCAVDRRLRETGSFNRPTRDIGGHNRLRNERNNEILNKVQENPHTSTRAVAAVLDLPQTHVWKCLNKDKLHPFHHQKVQGLEPTDYAPRIQFCDWFLLQSNTVDQFSRFILFTDEATFAREGPFNTHNTHTWAHENPCAIKQRAHQVRFSVNVWAGIIGDHLIGPHLLPQTLNGAIYTQFLEETLPTLLEDVPLEVRRLMWYMHDGAPAHFARTSRDSLNVRFPNRWIGRSGPIHWPARSPDLNPMDFYLWGHLKELVYETEVQRREELWPRIVDGCNKIRHIPGIFERVRGNLMRRAQACINANGGHFEQLLKQREIVNIV